MKLVVLLVFLFGMWQVAFAQANYSIEINGQSFAVQLNESFTYLTETGDSVQFVLSKTGKEIEIQPINESSPQSANTEQFEDSFLAFTYPANYAIAITQPAEGLQQISMINGSGGGIIIQEYVGMDPTELKEFFLQQLSTENKVESTKVENELGGQRLQGLQTKVNGQPTITVYSHQQQSGGVLLAIIGDEEKLSTEFFTSLQLK